MGDIPPPAGASNEYAREDGVPSPFHGSTSPGQSLHPSGAHPGAYQSAGYSSTLPPQAYANQQQHAFSSQLDMTQSQGSGRGNPYNMNAVMNTLPQQQQPYRSGQYPQSQQRFSSQSASPSTMQSQAPLQQQQYEAQGGISPMANQQYYLPQHAGSVPQYYSTSMSPPHPQTNVSSRGTMGGYYPSPVVMNQQVSAPATYYYPQAVQYGTPPANPISTHLVPGQYLSSTPPQTDPRMAAAQPTDHYGTSSYSQSRGSLSSETRQNIVRGPPRKPRQSGHAIWIGNLPPQTELMSLVHHVCKEAAGLESLFLISKSNCAFANFKDEASCIAAQQKLHDSKFQSVRLVSRLRKNTVEGASGITAPTGPAAGTSQTTSPGEAPARPDGASDSKEDAHNNTSTTTETASAATRPTPDGIESTVSSPQKDKFFILKSLTMEDLELSVQTGIWATQSHNEEILNKAFATADNVYLVFSANKSGEYFGYARMLSPINDDPAAAIEFAPKAQAATSDLDLPKAIPTEATEYAPRGRIIDDSARGTIFWEAEREENSNNNNNTLEIPGQDGEEGNSSGPGSAGDASSVRSEGAGGGKGEAKAWGKPFKLEWLSTTKLPFYRARGLRNPWNSNREVKIARDGTELEPTVGRRLIGLFNRVHSPVPPVAGGPGPMRGGHMPMMPGYPHMRPPYQH